MDKLVEWGRFPVNGASLSNCEVPFAVEQCFDAQFNF